MAETAAYREEQNVFGRFIEECTLPERPAGAWHKAEGTTATDLFDAFSGWAESAGERAMTSTAFGRKLVDRSIAKFRTSSARGYVLWLSPEGRGHQQRRSNARFR